MMILRDTKLRQIGKADYLIIIYDYQFVNSNIHRGVEDSKKVTL